LALVARSPISVNGPRGGGGLTIVDESLCTKILVKARWDGALAQALGIRFGWATRNETGTLVIGSAPGEWLHFAAPGTAAEVVAQVERLAAEAASSELVSVIDITHGRALVRITGARAADLLAKVCAIDFCDEVTPNGTAFRSSVAKLATDVVRDDREGLRSYLLHCERASGQYLYDALLDAGTEFGMDIDGFRGDG
jgi:heterotetrameric sarcosine oxidase gamma subunit